MRVLEFHRRQAKLNQIEFGALCGIPQTVVSDLELGKRPTAAQEYALERTLGIPIAALLKELPEDVVPPPPSMRLAIIALRDRQAKEKQRGQR